MRVKAAPWPARPSTLLKLCSLLRMLVCEDLRFPFKIGPSRIFLSLLAGFNLFWLRFPRGGDRQHALIISYIIRPYLPLFLYLKLVTGLVLGPEEFLVLETVGRRPGLVFSNFKRELSDSRPFFPLDVLEIAYIRIKYKRAPFVLNKDLNHNHTFVISRERASARLNPLSW